MMISLTVGKSNHRLIYLLLASAGSLLPWVYLLQFFLSPQHSVENFFQQALANPVSTAVATDLVISSLAFWVFAWQTLRASYAWTRFLSYLLLNLGIGLSCSLPLFLTHIQNSQDEG